jgi:hypothetical protein
VARTPLLKEGESGDDDQMREMVFTRFAAIVTEIQESSQVKEEREKRKKEKESEQNSLRTELVQADE